MNIEIDTLIEAYTILKEYIPTKDRQSAADTLMSVMVDLLSDPHLKDLSETDSYLKRSYAEYSHDDDDDDQDEYED